MSYYNSANDVRNALSDIICNRKSVDSKYVAFCTEMERQRLLNNRSHVSFIKFFPEKMSNGSEGHLFFQISGNGASVNNIDID